ncbi:MAG: peptide deformylase [SAR202 cluster bacterium]|nr:peptide deformylase [SAR202 cluster bacterium]
MAVLPMHYIDKDPILRKKARKVKDLQSPEIQRLIDDMIESMYHYRGVGIAANQVGSLHRIAIIQRPDDPEPLVLLNLELTRKEGEREVVEGCLSMPGWQGQILRAERVWGQALDRHGKRIRFKGETDLLAQALEHECDHLDGKLYIDYIRDKADLYEVEVGQEEDGEGEVAPEPGPRAVEAASKQETLR